MIDKRLRVLDQNPDIDYFKVGLEYSSGGHSNVEPGSDSERASTHTLTIRSHETTRPTRKKITTISPQKMANRAAATAGKENNTFAARPTLSMIHERKDSDVSLENVLQGSSSLVSVMSTITDVALTDHT